MNAALIRVSAWRQAGNGISATRLHRAGVEGATSAFVKTAVVRHGVMGRRWIVPPDGAAGGDGRGSGHIIGGTAIHQDMDCRRGRGGGPSHQESERET